MEQQYAMIWRSQQSKESSPGFESFHMVLQSVLDRQGIQVANQSLQKSTKYNFSTFQAGTSNLFWHVGFVALLIAANKFLWLLHEL